MSVTIRAYAIFDIFGLATPASGDSQIVFLRPLFQHRHVHDILMMFATLIPRMPALMCQVRQTVGGILPEIPVNAGERVPVPRGESGVIEIAVCDTNGFPFIVFERPVYARDNRTVIPCLEILGEEPLLAPATQPSEQGTGASEVSDSIRPLPPRLRFSPHR